MKKVILLAISVAILGCKKDEVETKQVEKQAIVTTYSDLGFAMYADATAKAKELKITIEAFVASPSKSGLDACKRAWENARVPYAHTEAYRFYGGPIDDVNTGREGFINAWPLDEAYIDYTSTNSISGIINNLSSYPTINSEIISELNQKNAENNVSSGYHAIEYILWGQDLSITAPGNRPYTDFVDGGTAKNQARRRSFLVAATDLLIKDLQSIADAWDKSKSNNYRANFTSNNELNNSLAKILIGLGKYNTGEMSGERISVSYTNSDQEDEHDCFSDYTMTDIRNWQNGLKSIYNGTYKQSNGTVLSGTSLASFLKKYDADLDKKMTEKFAKTDETLASITTTFDQAILVGNADYSKIATLITDLREQAKLYSDIVVSIGVLNEFNGLNTED